MSDDIWEGGSAYAALFGLLQVRFVRVGKVVSFSGNAPWVLAVRMYRSDAATLCVCRWYLR